MARMSIREKNKRSLARALALGLCTVCRSAPQRPHRKSCGRCVRLISSSAGRHRQKLKAAGLCWSCGDVPPAKPLGQCEPCRSEGNARVRAHQARRKARAEAEGLCTGCYKAARPEGRTRCADCVLDSRIRRYKQFGLTREQLQKLGDSCHICDSRKALVIDHGHVTESIRGLLCGTCNSGLGMFRDSPDLLIKAVSYLKAASLLGVAGQIDQPTDDGRATEAQPRYLN